MSKKRLLTWSETDRIAALKQGWDIFANDDEGGLEICKLDDPQGVAHDFHFTYKGPKWKSDSDAFKFVKEQAKKGRKVAGRALAVVRANPSVYAKEQLS